MRNIKKIPTIVGLIILSLGIASGVLLIENEQLFRLGAEPDINPKDIRISNISDSSLTISWTTDKSVQGFIMWGNSPTSIDQTTISRTVQESYIHSVTLTKLIPETEYYFKINSGGYEFDNDGIAWQTKTAPILTSSTQSSLIFGTILTSSGTPANNALVYVTVAGSSLLSTQTTAEGSWVMPISNARSRDLTSLITIDQERSLIEISIQSGPQGIALAQIYPESARPTPDIYLGETYNFTTIEPTKDSEIPEATVGLPNEATPSSRFDIPAPTSTPQVATETGLTIKVDCEPIKAYNQEWEMLTDNELNNLSVGSLVYFTIFCNNESGSLTKAIFAINNELSREVTSKNDNEEFYLSYIITENDIGQQMTVYAWVYDDTLDKWY